MASVNALALMVLGLCQLPSPLLELCLHFPATDDAVFQPQAAQRHWASSGAQDSLLDLLSCTHCELHTWRPGLTPTSSSPRPFPALRYLSLNISEPFLCHSCCLPSCSGLILRS